MQQGAARRYGAGVAVAGEVLASRQQSTMASTWREYLCLEPISAGCWRLVVAGENEEFLPFDAHPEPPEGFNEDEDDPWSVDWSYKGRPVRRDADGFWIFADDKVRLAQQDDERCWLIRPENIAEAIAILRDDGWDGLDDWAEVQQRVRSRLLGK